MRFDGALADAERMLLFDAQTSGGLLVALAPESLPVFERAMQTRGAAWWVVGGVIAREQPAILVT